LMETNSCSLISNVTKATTPGPSGNIDEYWYFTKGDMSYLIDTGSFYNKKSGDLQIQFNSLAPSTPSKKNNSSVTQNSQETIKNTTNSTVTNNDFTTTTLDECGLIIKHKIGTLEKQEARDSTVHIYALKAGNTLVNNWSIACKTNSSGTYFSGTSRFPIKKEDWQNKYTYLTKETKDNSTFFFLTPSVAGFENLVLVQKNKNIEYAFTLPVDYSSNDMEIRFK